MRVQCIQKCILNFGVAGFGDPKQDSTVAQPDGISICSDLKGMPQQQDLVNKSPLQYVEKEEIRIPNILTIPSNIIIPPEAMIKNGKLSPLNPSGLYITREDGQETTKITIKNDQRYPIGIAIVKKGTELPEITYKQGKFMPELTIKHPSLNGSRVKMLSGSELIAKNFSVVMPGEIRVLDKAIPITTMQGLSFKGHITVSTLKNEDATKDAIDSFIENGFTKDVIRGRYADELVREQPSIVIPAGGFGERFYNLTRGKLNKPAYYLPTNKNYRIMGTTLSMISAAGVLEGNGKDTVTYLSQTHEISGENVVNTTKYDTDGGAITEGLVRGEIPNDKDLIVLNADIFTNTDITRAYHALKSIPDAALVIPYYLVDNERAKSLGLLGIAKFEGDYNQVSSFAEKTIYIDQEPTEPNSQYYKDFSEYAKSMEEFKKNMSAHITAKIAKSPDGQTYYANPGVYLFSKECIPIIKKMQDEAGFGNDIVPKITELCRQGKLKNAQGVQLKVYTLPLQRVDGQDAYWDDIGSAGAYLKTVRDVAFETAQKGTSEENKFYGVPEFILEDFRDNVDLNTFVLFQSKQARTNFEAFKTAVGVAKVQGNIFVVD